MLYPLIIQAPAGETRIPTYTAPPAPQARALLASGNPKPGGVTRARGDRLPQPSPRAFRITVPAESLAAAYDAAYSLAEVAQGATRVVWHGGAFDVERLTRYHMEPAGPTDLTLELEFLPARPPTHPGDAAPMRADAWRHSSYTDVTDAGGILRVHHIDDAAPASAYYDIGAAPYDPDHIDLAALITLPAQLGEQSGIYLGAISAQILTTGGLRVNLGSIATDAPAPAPQPGERWAMRLQLTRPAANYQARAKAWSARTHPEGEPPGWMVEAAFSTVAPVAAGIITDGGPHLDVHAMTLAYSGWPAPIGRP